VKIENWEIQFILVVSARKVLARWEQDEHSSAGRGISFESERVTGFPMQIWKAPDVFYPRSTNQYYFLHLLLVISIGREVWNNLT
jgi:hypothetical protein